MNTAQKNLLRYFCSTDASAGATIFFATISFYHHPLNIAPEAYACLANGIKAFCWWLGYCTLGRHPSLVSAKAGTLTDKSMCLISVTGHQRISITLVLDHLSCQPTGRCFPSSPKLPLFPKNENGSNGINLIKDLLRI